jgi:hypothetical protein
VTPWKLPLLGATIAVPFAFGFYLGGFGIGVGIGALVAAGLVFHAGGTKTRSGRRPPAN